MSAIPAAKAALVAALDASSDLADVLVVQGVADPANPEQIEVNAATAEREFRGLGGNPNPLNETLRLTVIVTVAARSGSDFTATDERLWAIVAAAEAAFRADMKLGGVLKWGWIRSVSQSYFVDQKQRGSQATLTLEGFAPLN